MRGLPPKGKSKVKGKFKNKIQNKVKNAGETPALRETNSKPGGETPACRRGKPAVREANSKPGGETPACRRGEPALRRATASRRYNCFDCAALVFGTPPCAELMRRASRREGLTLLCSGDGSWVLPWAKGMRGEFEPLALIRYWIEACHRNPKLPNRKHEQKETLPQPAGSLEWGRDWSDYSRAAELVTWRPLLLSIGFL